MTINFAESVPDANLLATFNLGDKAGKNSWFYLKFASGAKGGEVTMSYGK